MRRAFMIPLFPSCYLLHYLGWVVHGVVENKLFDTKDGLSCEYEAG
jgi:hypothetical protein